MTDMTFIDNGMFVTLMPNNPDAEKAWNIISEAFPGCSIPFTAWPSVKSQLKAAGYSVRKQRKMKPVTSEELDGLLAELGV